jgi:hypothetical protein
MRVAKRAEQAGGDRHSRSHAGHAPPATLLCSYHAFGNVKNGSDGEFSYQHGPSEWGGGMRRRDCLQRGTPRIPLAVAPAKPLPPHARPLVQTCRLAVHGVCTAVPPCAADEGKYNRYILCAQHFHPKQREWWVVGGACCPAAAPPRLATPLPGAHGRAPPSAPRLVSHPLAGCAASGLRTMHPYRLNPHLFSTASG